MIPIPDGAREAWLDLADALAELPPPPCSAQPENWWPDHPTHITTGPAAACRTCPARTPCLDYALAADEQSGIWGGTTPAQRAEARG